MKIRKATNVRAVERAIDILEAFTPETPALSLSELGRRVRLNRPTLYRMLSTLAKRGLVRQAGDPPRYRLDSGVARLAEVWSGALDVAQLAAPLLAALHARFDETVALYLRRGDARVCAAELPSRQPLSFSRGIGHAESLRLGASGYAILAFAPQDEVDAILRQEKDASRRRRLRGILDEVRARGHALSGGDLIVGTQAIAAPVLGRTGHALASIGLFGPAARFPPARIAACAEAVMRAAASLSRALGHCGTPPI